MYSLLLENVATLLNFNLPLWLLQLSLLFFNNRKLQDLRKFHQWTSALATYQVSNEVKRSLHNEKRTGTKRFQKSSSEIKIVKKYSRRRAFRKSHFENHVTWTYFFREEIVDVIMSLIEKGTKAKIRSFPINFGQSQRRRKQHTFKRSGRTGTKKG